MRRKLIIGAKLIIAAGALVGGAALLACGGDITSGQGELGRLRYTLYTAYEVPQDNLTQALIITGHPQRLDINLTTLGRREVTNPSAMVHTMEPTTGATVETVDSGVTDTVPSATITVTTAGTYDLVSAIGTEVIDRIALQFATPVGFELNLKVRLPWGEAFQPVVPDPVTPLQVEEGSQLLVLPIPTDALGARLAGVMTPTITVTPLTSVTSGYNVITNTENSYTTLGEVMDYYFIEPGLVTFTIADSVTGASAVQQFAVYPVGTVP